MIKKKLVALGLATVMVASVFAGCGSKNAGETDATVANGSGDGRPTISIMTIDHSGSPLSADGSDEVKERVFEYTNTNVEFTFVANDSYEDKLGVTLMDQKNMPMIITVGGDMNATIVSAAKAGAFWDLNDFIWDKEKYPNLSQANKDVMKQLVVDGQQIGVYRARPIGRNGLGYRKDWADKLGLSEPETIEDVYNMAYAFTKNDPDGNGIDDTYGLALCKYDGPFDIIQAWFGAGNGWVEKDGELVPSFETEEYLEALNWIRKMYDEGLVYQDFAVRDTNTWQDGVKNGECGMMLDVLDSSTRIWDYLVNNQIPAVNGDATASMNLVGAIKKDENSEPVTQATSGMGGFFVITKAAKTEEDVENCLTFLDKMCDDEMLTLADYGLEGKTYTVEDGKIVANTQLQPNEKAMNGLNQVVAYIPNITLDNVKRTERKELEEEIKADNVQYAVFNPAAGYLVNSETYSMNGASLDQIMDDARIQYICGQIDESGLQAAIKNWETQGGSKVKEEVNALYQADQTK